MDEKFDKRLSRVWSRVHPSLHERLNEAIRAMSQAGGRSFREVLALVRDRGADPQARKDACLILGHLGDRRALPALLGALRDPDAEIRVSAVRGFGMIGSPRVLAPLVAALYDDPDEKVCLMAARSLVWQTTRHGVDPSSAMQVLHNYIQRTQHMQTAHSVAVRRDIVRSLWFLSDARVVAPLVAALRDPDPELRYLAARSLQGVWPSMRDPPDASEAIRELERLASTDEAVIPGLGSIKEQANLTLGTLRRRQQR